MVRMCQKGLWTSSEPGSRGLNLPLSSPWNTSATMWRRLMWKTMSPKERNPHKMGLIGRQIRIGSSMHAQLLSRVWLFCDPVHCSQPDASVSGISQARILETTATSFSSDLPKPRIKPRSCLGRQVLYHWGTRTAHIQGHRSQAMVFSQNEMRFWGNI